MLKTNHPMIADVRLPRPRGASGKDVGAKQFRELPINKPHNT